MKRCWERICRDNRGFTLVELLVVISLMAILVAIVIPNVSGLIGYGQTEGGNQERSIVQTAMDSMMARESLASVTVTDNKSDMSTFPTGNPLYPGYLRYATTKGTYSCNGTGLVTQESNGY